MSKRKDNKVKIDTAISATGRIESEYVALVDGIGYPIDCTVYLPGKSDDIDYKPMHIKEIKRTVSFLTESGAISYKTLTHAIYSKTEKFGIACTSNGKCEIYKIDKKDGVQSKFIASIRPSKKVIDPVFAFMRDGMLDIVFNVPTQAAIDMGVKGRKPLTAENDPVAIMNGSPYVAEVNVEEKSTKRVSPSISKMPRYAAFLTHDADKVPVLVVCNLLSAKKNKEKETESLFSLIKSIFEDAEEDKVTKQKELPFGVSALTLAEKSEYVLVNPVTGLDGVIDKIDILPSEESGVNNFDVVYEGDEQAFVEDSEQIAEILEIEEKPSSHDGENTVN